MNTIKHFYSIPLSVLIAGLICIAPPALADEALDCSREPRNYSESYQCTQMRINTLMLSLTQKENELREKLNSKRTILFDMYRKSAAEEAEKYCDFRASLYIATQSTAIKLFCLEDKTQQYIVEIEEIIELIK